MHHVVSRLGYNMSYTLEIYGKNAKNDLIEGNKCILKFTTPTCRDIHKTNLEKCRKRFTLSNRYIECSGDLSNHSNKWVLHVYSTTSTDEYQFNLWNNWTKYLSGECQLGYAKTPTTRLLQRDIECSFWRIECMAKCFRRKFCTNKMEWKGPIQVILINFRLQ